MGVPPDESLPEVVPDQSPQALSHQEAHYCRDQLNERDPKYPANFDDAPKYLATSETDEAPEPVHGSEYSFASAGGSPPWELQSTADNLQAGDRSPTNEKAAEPTICGLRRRSFWLLLVVVLVVIAASVGGGVVGGIAAGKNNRTSDGSNPGASNRYGLSPVAIYCTS